MAFEEITDCESIPVLVICWLLKCSSKIEKARLGSSTLIRVGFTSFFNSRDLLTITIEAFDVYKKSLYLELPKNDNELFSPFSILDNLLILEFLSPSTTPSINFATSNAFNSMTAKI